MKIDELDPILLGNVSNDHYTYIWDEETNTEGKTKMKELVDSAKNTSLDCTVGTGGDFTTFELLKAHLEANTNIRNVTVTVTSNFAFTNDMLILKKLENLSISFGNYNPTASCTLIAQNIDYVTMTSGTNLGGGQYPLNISFSNINSVSLGTISLGAIGFSDIGSVSIVSLTSSTNSSNLYFDKVGIADINCAGNKTLSLSVINSRVYINDQNTIYANRTEISSISMTKLSTLAIDNTITVVPTGWETSKIIQDGSNYGQYYKGN